jgi:hypothetical protein
MTINLCNSEGVHVGAEAQIGGDGIHSSCMLSRLLPDVQCHDVQAERRDLADNVQEGAVRNRNILSKKTTD